MTRALRRLGGERGYTLVEMLTVIAIMGVVMTGLTTLFVQGSNSQLDLNRRFEAQQGARVALDKMRREIHCASMGNTVGGNGTTSAVTLRLPHVCPTAGGVQIDVTWCTVSAGTSRWALYRRVGVACDATGVKWADYLTQAAIFDYQTQSTARLARLRVVFPVDVKPGDATPAYTLCDVITLRNSLREAPTAADLGYTDTADPASC